MVHYPPDNVGRSRYPTVQVDLYLIHLHFELVLVERDYTTLG